MRVCKQCRECKRWLARDQRNFYRTCARDKDGYMGICRVCHAEYNRERKLLKREAVLQQQRQYDARPERRATRLAYRLSPRGREVARLASLRYSRWKRIQDQCSGVAQW